jgi:hypothetical protein
MENKNILKKLLAVQKEIHAIKKDSKNPFFKSNYFDINSLIQELKPLLNEQGIVVLQPLANVAGRPAIETIVFDAESGESISNITVIPDNADSQKMGSAITYFRRYALQSFFFLQAEDDDGNTAKPAPTKKAKTYLNDETSDLPF